MFRYGSVTCWMNSITELSTGKQVDLVQPAMDDMFEQANAALEAGAARLAFPLLSTSDCLESRSPGPQQP